MRNLRGAIQIPIQTALLTIFLSLILSGASLWAATMYISPTGGGDGSGPGSPTTLQAALTTAQANGESDTLYLQAGEYPAGNNLFSYTAGQNDEVRMTGGWNVGFTTQYRGMDPISMTALKGRDTTRILQILNDVNGVTVKFTIENTGFLNGKATDTHGAGLRSNCTNGGTINLYVRRCLFQNNNGAVGATNTSGGGLFTNGYTEIYDSVFSNNAAFRGGAIYLTYVTPLTSALEPLVERCTFNNNKTLEYTVGCTAPGVSKCYEGGGDIFSRVSPIIRNTTISGDGTLSGGGAIDHGYAGNLRLINSTISGKRGWFWGGGIHIWDANAEIYNSLIADNAAGQSGVWGRGGGIAIYDHNENLPGITPTPRTVKVFNSTFVKNSSNGTDDGLVGMAIDNRVETLTVYNSIFWDNGAAGQFPIFTSTGGTSSLDYSDYQYGWGGAGSNNISTDPAFVNFAGNNFRLTGSSPCKDTGTETPSGTFLYALYPTSSDIEGRQRIMDTVDRGAYEFDTSPFAHATGRDDPSLAYDPVNQRYLAVYSSLDGNGGATLNGRLINPDGTPFAAEFQISEQKSYLRLLKSVAYDAFNKKFVVVWDIFNGSTSDQDIQGQLVNPDGTLDGWNFTVSNQTAVKESRPAITYDDTGQQTLVVWNDEFLPTNEKDVLGRFFVKDIAQGAAAFPVGAEIGNAQADPGVAFDSVNNRFLVVWADERNSGTAGIEIYGQVINSDRTFNGGNFSITENRAGDQGYPTATFNPSAKQFLVVWEDSQSGNVDIYGRLVNYNGNLAGTSFPISNTAAVQGSASVAFHPLARRFLAVWQDSRDVSAGWNIYGQWLKEDGALLGSNFPIINANNDQNYPKVAYGPGNFLAVYEEMVNPGPPPSLEVGYVKIAYRGITAKSIGNGSGSLTSSVGGINYLHPAVNEMDSSVLSPGVGLVITATADPAVNASWNGTCTAAGGTESGNGTELATCTFAGLDGYQWVQVTFTEQTVTQYKLWLPLILR